MRIVLLLSACALLLTDAAWAQSAATGPQPKPGTRDRGVRILRPEPQQPQPQPQTPLVAPAAEPSAPAGTDPVEPKPSGPASDAKARAEPSNVAVAEQPVCARAVPTADLVYSDDRAFGSSLRTALAARPERLVLDVPGFAPDGAPAWLGPWLAELHAAGGVVEQRPIPCGERTRGMSLGRLLRNLFGGEPRESRYAPVRGYDAIFWTEKTSGRVTQVQFNRKISQEG